MILMNLQPGPIKCQFEIILKGKLQNAFTEFKFGAAFEHIFNM